MRCPMSPTGMPSEPTVSHTPMHVMRKSGCECVTRKSTACCALGDGRIAALAIQREGVLHRGVDVHAERQLLRIDYAAVAHHAREAAHRVRAAAEAEEIDVVARMIVIDEKSVALPDVAIEPVAERAAHHAINEAAGADARMVVRELRRAVVRVRLHELIGEPHVRRGRVAHGVRRLRAVPRAVRADDDALVRLANGIRGEILAQIRLRRDPPRAGGVICSVGAPRSPPVIFSRRAP